MKRVYEGDSPYLFISYAHRNTDTVVPIVEKLVDRGFRVWYDAGIEAGTEWPEYIADHLRRCSRCICFISDEFLASQNCTRELSFATKLGKPPFIVYLGEPELSLGMQMRLGTMQALYYDRHPTRESFLSELVRAEGIGKCRVMAGSEDYYTDILIEARALYSKKKYAAAKKVLEGAVRSAHADSLYLYATCILEDPEEESDESRLKALPYLLDAAEKNHAGAAYTLTQRYAEENYLERLGKNKPELLKSAALGGNVDAMYMLSFEYSEAGKELGDTATYWKVKAAENGHIRAINALSSNRATESGREWLRRAAGMGYAHAQYELSREYLTGRYFERSDELALEWCIISAEGGHEGAIIDLAKRYEVGNGVSRDCEKALELYLKVIEHSRDLNYKNTACVGAGDLYYKGIGTEKNVNRAIEYYERAEFSKEAKYRLALCLFRGEGVKEADPVSAIGTIKEIADSLNESRGHAHNTLGWCYENGIVLERNEKRALSCYRLSANHGFAGGMYSLAMCYENGVGTEINIPEAIAYYEKARDLGHEGASLALERLSFTEGEK